MHIALFVRAATEGWTIKSNVLGEIKIFVICVWKRRVRKIGLKKIKNLIMVNPITLFLS